METLLHFRFLERRTAEAVEYGFGEQPAHFNRQSAETANAAGGSGEGKSGCGTAEQADCRDGGEISGAELTFGPED